MSNQLAVIASCKTIAEVISKLAKYDIKDTIPLKHTFQKNLLTRNATYPKGSIIVGRVHKFDHVFMIVRGKITIWGDGVPRKTFVGPVMFETKAGTQRIGLAHTEVEVMNIHGIPDGVVVNESNVEEYLTTVDLEAYNEFSGIIEVENTCAKTSILYEE